MRNLASALLHTKCPRCREGNVFQYPGSNLIYFYKISDQCPVCGVSLHPEPGFYQGAMYVSYGFTVAIVVAVSLLLYIIGNPEEWIYVTTNICAMILLAPLNYRYSRILYLYWFGGIKFDPKKVNPTR